MNGFGRDIQLRNKTADRGCIGDQPQQASSIEALEKNRRGVLGRFCGWSWTQPRSNYDWRGRTKKIKKTLIAVTPANIVNATASEMP